MSRIIRWVVVLAVVGGLIGGGFYVYWEFVRGGGGGTDLTQYGIDADQEVQIIAVRRGNLSNSVSVNGSLRYSKRETYTIPFSGNIREVLVETGDQVSEGDVLFIMDEAALIEATADFRKAQVELIAAQAALDDLIDPPPNILNPARVAAESARLALADAEEALASALNPEGKAYRDAAADLDEARDELDAAQDAFDDATIGVGNAEHGVTAAEDGIIDAEAALRAATDDVAEFDDQMSEYEVDKATDDLDRARRDLELARSASVTTRVGADASVRVAQRQYDDAYEDYYNTWQRWLGIDLAAVSPDGEVEPLTLFAILDIDLDAIYGREARKLARNLSREAIENPLPDDDPSTIWDEVVVATWLRFNSPILAADCGKLLPSRDLVCILQDFTDSWDELLPVMEARDAALSQADQTRERADRSVVDAERALRDAQAVYDSIFANPERGEERRNLVSKRDLAESALENARLQLTAAQSRLERAQRDVLEAQEDLDAARLAHDEAVAVFTDFLDPNGDGVKPYRLDVESAQADLYEAEQALAAIEDPDLAEVELKRAELVVAQRAFDDAKIENAEGQVVAEFDGVVGDVRFEDGDAARSGEETVVVADPESVEMRGSVDEVDVLFLQVGDFAEVEMDALGGDFVFGTITDIAAFGTTTQGSVFGASFEQDIGSVSYPVTIAIDAPGGTTLPEGLSANAQVVIRDIQNVLLVPAGAVFGSLQEPQLLVRTSTNPDTFELVPVVLGVSDDFWTEVISGVEEGQDVLMTVVGAQQGGFFFR